MPIATSPLESVFQPLAGRQMRGECGWRSPPPLRATPGDQDAYRFTRRASYTSAAQHSVRLKRLGQLGVQERGAPGQDGPAIFAFSLPKASAQRLHQKMWRCELQKPKAPENLAVLRGSVPILRSQPRRLGLGHPLRARPRADSINLITEVWRDL